VRDHPVAASQIARIFRAIQLGAGWRAACNGPRSLAHTAAGDVTQPRPTNAISTPDHFDLSGLLRQIAGVFSLDCGATMSRRTSAVGRSLKTGGDEPRLAAATLSYLPATPITPAGYAPRWG
jgi:hypothetical protein